MAQYTVIRSCGHEEIVSLFGKERDRQWRIENVEEQRLCYDCYLAEQAAKNAAAAEEAQEQGLPELTGTEKQVPWAESIRLKMRERFGELVSRIETETENAGKPGTRSYGEEDLEKARDEIAQAHEVMDHILATRTRAVWWIDHRSASTSDAYLQDLLTKNIKSAQKAKAEAAPAAIEAKAEATVRPAATPVTETVAEIRITESDIEISFPERRDDFREIVRKRLDFRWSYEASCWRRPLDFKMGKATDRAAEAGHLLLAARIPIRIYDPDVREKAVAGSYEPECRRWVTTIIKGDYEGWFAVTWDRRVDDFYQAARKIPGSRWVKPFTLIPPEQFEAILDFAEQYEFQLSRGAQQIVEQAQRARDAAAVADVSAEALKRQADGIVTGRKPPKLEAPKEVGIDESLRD